jgi:hypothetical protein
MEACDTAEVRNAAVRIRILASARLSDRAAPDVKCVRMDALE